MIAEALVWHGLGAGFLFLYSDLRPIDRSVVFAHLSLVTILWGFIVCFRAAVWRFFPFRRVAGAINALVVAVCFSILVSYYLAVLAGLKLWGRVISWPLIETYSRDSVGLLQALGVSPVLALGGAGLSILAFAFGWWQLSSRTGWVRELSWRMSLPAILVCIIGGVSIVCVQTLAFTMKPMAREGEPVSLTFFPAQEARVRQSHALANDPLRELAEREAREAYVPAIGANRPNVILIVGDALRPDHMSLYGYSRPTTPRLDAIASRGRLSKAERMVAVCAESTCGLLGITRSKYVHEVTEQDFTLTEVLRRHGYRFHLILSGDHTNFYGMREAYGQVDSYYDGASASGRYMNDDRLILDRLSTMPAWNDEQTMIQFHLMSAHGLGTRHPSARRYQPATNYYKVGAVQADESSDPVQEAVNFYDNGVLQFDDTVGRILDALEAKGYLEDAIVAITADHGELLGEYGVFAHAATVHEQVLRVPFVLLRFGRASERPFAEKRLSSQIDIAPTLLAELGMPIPKTWSGRSLYQAEPRDFVGFQQGTHLGLYDLRDPGRIWKYVVELGTGAEFVFDVTADADESRNVIAAVDPGLHGDWKREIMRSGAATVIRSGCCESQAGVVLRQERRN